MMCVRVCVCLFVHVLLIGCLPTTEPKMELFYYPMRPWLGE